MKTPLSFSHWLVINSGLLALLIGVSIAASLIGSSQIDFSQIFTPSLAQDILFSSRLPRILLGGLVGLALGSAGATFQALLRNPLADPYILGVSGGAALGSVLAVGFKLPFTLVSIVAFIAAMATMFLIYWIASTKRRLPSHTLLLTGVIFNAFSFAIILFVNSIVTLEEAHQILFLLIGSLEAESYLKIASVAFFVLSGFTLLMVFSSKLNLLSLGDETAIQLGVNVEKFRTVIFFAASLMIGAVVSVSGLIGFVGLFIPHVARLLFGADHRLLIPSAGLLGAAFLILSDTAARTVLAGGAYQTQLPVGVITALVGAPFFVYLLKKQQRSLE